MLVPTPNFPRAASPTTPLQEGGMPLRAHAFSMVIRIGVSCMPRAGTQAGRCLSYVFPFGKFGSTFLELGSFSYLPCPAHRSCRQTVAIVGLLGSF